jgi:predicted MFS family arabinose efflux permease
VTPSRRIGSVLLPFAAGYYLSYLFRSINALIAADLTAELDLSAADLGLLTSVYFLVFAAAQVPCGILLDRHGPRTLQSGLLLLASAGALLFALADTLVGLMLGRALIGVGVALALMAGFKAIVLWFPAERLALVNGWFVMLGALGAVTATAPAELLVAAIGWRGLFAVLGGLSALAALLIVGIVPDESQPSPSPVRPQQTLTLLTIYRERRFWRLAPLSAMGVGTSWSLQGLWAAPWLKDVDGLDRGSVVAILSIMGIVVSASGLMLGFAANHVRRRGGKTEHVLVATVAVSIVELRHPRPILSARGLRPCQRRLEPAARCRRLRPAIADGAHFTAVAGRRGPLSRRGAPVRHGRRARVRTSGARLVPAAAAGRAPAGTHGALGHGRSLDVAHAATR